MSRLNRINERYKQYSLFDYNFVLIKLLRKLVKDGNINNAKRIIINAFNFISKKEKKNSYLVFLIALYNISPRAVLIKEWDEENKKIVYKKRLISKIESAIWGIDILIKLYKKNKGESLYMKLANEIILSFYKRSYSTKRKQEIEREIIKKTAKNFARKKKLKFVIIK